MHSVLLGQRIYFMLLTLTGFAWRSEQRRWRFGGMQSCGVKRPCATQIIAPHVLKAFRIPRVSPNAGAEHSIGLGLVLRNQAVTGRAVIVVNEPSNRLTIACVP